MTYLIDQLKAGDRAAVQPLWERYYPRLVALARKRLQGSSRRVSDQSDVATDAFDSFCRAAEAGRFPSLKDRDDLWSLLVMIAARKAADLVTYNRRKKRRGGRVRGDSALAGYASADAPEGFDQFEGNDLTPDMAAQLAEELQSLLNRLEDPEDPALRQIAVWKLDLNQAMASDRE
jgi:DNA-directed RNA polymerase specialized sigma24 family protein